MARRSRPTLQDVAQASGVSIASVSRILNGMQSGSSETARKVQLAARKLKYAPASEMKQVTRAASGRTGRMKEPLPRKVHILTRRFDAQTQAFYHQIVEGCFDHFASHQVHLKVTYLNNAPGTRLNLDAATYQMHDGALFIGERVDDVMQGYLQQGKPVVVVDDDPCEPAIDWIMPDNTQGIASLVERFIARGHRWFGYAGPVQGVAAWRERFHAFLGTLAQHGIRFDHHHHVDCLPLDEQVRQAMVTYWRKKTSRPHPTVMVCANDAIASAVLQQSIALGLRVPQDLAISGFDHDLPFQLTTPRLTTVDFSRDAMGRLAAARLLARLQGDTLPGLKILVPTTLIPGQSAGFEGGDSK